MGRVLERGMLAAARERRLARQAQAAMSDEDWMKRSLQDVNAAYEKHLAGLSAGQMAERRAQGWPGHLTGDEW